MPTLTAPVTSHNLAAWFVLAPGRSPSGPGRLDGPATPGGAGAAEAHPGYLVLEEAIDRATALVHETGSVNELLIENSGDIDLFIQAGDIVKGGRQDRTIGVDFVVPARSGRIPLSVFCVEQSRWHRRGREATDHFTSSKHAVSSKKAHLAMSISRSQTEVWKTVAEEQAALARSLAADAACAASPTSLQLTYELEHVSRAIDDYTRPLEQAPSAAGEVVGVVWAIDGRLSHAHLYSLPGLFSKRWGKLLRAAATEALGSRSGATPAPAGLPTEPEILAWLDRGKAPLDDLQADLEADLKTALTAESISLPTTVGAEHGGLAVERLPPRTLLRRSAGHETHRVECFDTDSSAAGPVHVAILAS
jgi:hypothetical protein